MPDILNHQIIKIGQLHISVASVVYAFVILLIARLIEVLLVRFIQKTYLKKSDDLGGAYAISRIIRYLIYFIAIIAILKTFGLNLSAIVLGSAGLLVGLGLGLQHTFTDLLAGIILLVERNIAVGDVVVIDGMVGVVKNIKLRTTEIKTRDLVFIIVPNSKLMGNNVTNWSHNESPARFSIDINIYYNEDIDRVESILLKCVSEMEDIVKNPKPQVQVLDFGEYAIKLRLFVFSDELFYIEKVLSDLRRKIAISLKENDIHIPVPISQVQVLRS